MCSLLWLRNPETDRIKGVLSSVNDEVDSISDGGKFLKLIGFETYEAEAQIGLVKEVLDDHVFLHVCHVSKL